MPTKTMNVSVAAYDALAGRKRPGESFTDVILRLTRPSGLAALEGVLSEDEARALAQDHQAARKRNRERRRRMDDAH